MMKRVLAFLCVLALMMGMYVVPATAAEASAEEGGLYVGYVKGDINPWLTETTTKGEAGIVIPEDVTITVGENAVELTGVYTYDPATDTYGTETKQLLMAPMGGYANSTERLSTGLQDDNADGKTGYGDGIFFTCTTVTDPSNNYTLFMFTTDTVSGYSGLREDVAAGIRAAMAEYDIPVSENQITLSGSHSHGGVDFGTLRSAKTQGTNALWAAYYDYVVNKMVTSAVNAAMDAIENKKEATMSQGSIDATTVQHAGNETYQMNQMRIYYTQQIGANGKPTGINFVSGSHLNTYANAGKTVNGYTYESEPLADADDTMYILQFEIEGEAPIILINWRAHATTMTPNANTNLSSDYINSLRYALETNENQNYRAAFIQGAGGNIVAGDAWVDEYFDAYVAETENIAGGDTSAGDEESNEDGNASANENRWAKGTYYGGTLLANVALECLNSKMVEQKGNTIRAVTNEVDLDMQTDDADVVKLAANHYPSCTTSHYHPIPETVDGTTYHYINDKSHARSIISRAERLQKGTADTAADMTVSAFKLGESVSIVTAPGEMYDRYSLDVKTLKQAQADVQDNDWYDLEKVSGNMPLVFGYTNGHSGYIGNYISYIYNDVIDDNDTPGDGLYNNYPDGLTIDGKYGVSVGSYEASTSVVAQGGGEKIIEAYGRMLSSLSDVCEHCGTEITEKTALTKANASTLKTLTAGHYYLDEDVTWSAHRTVTGKVCLDLNGHTITTNNCRAFYCRASGTEFSLMDSSVEQDGKVIAYNNSEGIGGVVHVYNTAAAADWTADGVIFNLYGGTLQLASEDGTGNMVEKGGVVSLYGTMNMFGGTIQGGTLKAVSPNKMQTSTGCGGAIFAYQKSVLNVYGGKIYSGDGLYEAGTFTYEVVENEETVVKTVKANPRGTGVFLAANSTTMTLSGDAVVQEIYISTTNGDEIKVSSDFTGTAVLNPESLTVAAAGLKVGSVQGTLRGTLACNGDYQVEASGEDLMITAYTGVARIGGDCYETIAEAIGAYQIGSNNYITLLGDVEEEMDIVGKTIYMDLNGNSISSVTSSKNSGTLYCLDSETDDYEIEVDADDNYYGYGIIGGYGEKVTLKPVTLDDNLTQNSYIMVNEEGKGYSFHCVDMQLTDMSLRTMPDETTGERNPGLYFKSTFGGDALVAELVDTYGVALSLVGAPTAETMGTTTQYSWFNDFVAGKNNANSTLLSGIMKESSNDLRNTTNANKQIYGSTYVKLTTGEYIFGVCENRSLKEQVEEVNNAWSNYNQEEQEGVIQLYRAYRSILPNWEIETIAQAFQDSKPLMLLGIGNSFTGDSMKLLAEVYKAENNDREIKLGYLYHSGCTLAMHKQYIRENAKEYIYYELQDDGTWKADQGDIVGYDDEGNPIYSGVTMDHGLQQYEWDMVCMQQGSIAAGNVNAYNSDISYIQNFVSRTLGYKPTYFWNMCWAYPDYSERFDPVNGQTALKGSNTVDMFASIVATTENKILPLVGENKPFSFYVPTGTAIWNARKALLEIDASAMDSIANTQNLYYDQLHLGGYGSAIAAYTWYCTLNNLTELDSFKLTTLPKDLVRGGKEITVTPEQQEIALDAVNAALTNPLPDDIS